MNSTLRTSPIEPFTFTAPPRVVFAEGAAETLGESVDLSLGPRVLLVTDAGLRALGIVDPAVASLEAAGADVAIFDRVEADPSVATVDAAVDAARAHDATGVCGFGGGSPLDVAKSVALLVGSGASLDAVWGVGRARGPRLPLVLVPTTAGTGSEMTPIAILTVGETEKRGISSPWLQPDLAVLDPLLTLGLPPAITAATGVDAMVHAIEAYTSKSPNNNPVSRALAREALRLLGGAIERAVEDGTDRAARGAMLLGSMLAGQAFANAPVAAVHALAYPIGGTFHVPHGLSNALVLPHVLRFNAGDAACGCRTLYAELGACTFSDDGADSADGAEAADGGDACDRFVERLAQLTARLGLATRLREVGIGEEHLETMADDAMIQQRLLVNNPRPLGRDDALAIYRAAW